MGNSIYSKDSANWHERYNRYFGSSAPPELTGVSTVNCAEYYPPTKQTDMPTAAEYAKYYADVHGKPPDTIMKYYQACMKHMDNAVKLGETKTLCDNSMDSPTRDRLIKLLRKKGFTVTNGEHNMYVSIKKE